jgi:hypothetical protein
VTKKNQNKHLTKLEIHQQAKTANLLEYLCKKWRLVDEEIADTEDKQTAMSKTKIDANNPRLRTIGVTQKTVEDRAPSVIQRGINAGMSIRATIMGARKITKAGKKRVCFAAAISTAISCSKSVTIAVIYNQ